mgnify:CR=1 FL=1
MPLRTAGTQRGGSRGLPRSESRRWRPSGYRCMVLSRDFLELLSLLNETRAEALRALGFSGVGLTTEDFTRPDAVVQLGHPPQRVDLADLDLLGELP